ncbi:GNAT family N-acetyltransferase [Clostridium sp.]
MALLCVVIYFIRQVNYAIEFYHHLGFFNTDEEITVNGIRFTPMSYLLK